MKRSEKAVLIEKIKTAAEASSISVIADFKGMPVEEMTRLRVKIRENGGQIIVVKNTLARIALAGTLHDPIKDMFKENCALAFGGEDSVALAKAIVDFAKTSKTLEVRHACLDGTVLDTSQLQELAKLPGKQELLAMTLGTLNAVPTNFVSLLSNTIRGMLYALKAIEQNKAA